MRDQDEDWWGAEHVVISFTAWAECSNKACAEKFALSGTGGVDAYPDEDWNTVYAEAYEIRHCHPPLQLIRLPSKCPEIVKLALMAAFSLYWIDRPSSAGRIRVAVERLLDHLGIPDSTATGGFIALDRRIEMFSKNDPAQGAHLMALKWLGNLGSHTVDVNKEDLLSAFEVFEHVLAETVENKSATISKLADAMTAKYGSSHGKRTPDAL